MSQTIKNNTNALGWQRKPGSLRVWNVVEGKEKTADGETLRFSIQEIPEDRYEDAVDLMCDIYLQDEPTCAHFKTFNDPEAIIEFRKLWNFVLQQGIAVGAFLVDEENSKPIMAGVNMTMVKSVAIEEAMALELNLKTQSAHNFCNWVSGLEKEVNILKLYNVDKYISSFGLCVNRSYRCQGLGYHLLMARNEMSVAYNIQGTSTIFTSSISQKTGAKAGFETLIKGMFADVRNKDGLEMFPGVPEKFFMLMGKQFPISH